MNPISPAVQQALQLLYKKQPVMGRLLGWPQKRMGALDVIEASRERAAMPLLLALLLDEDASIRRRAVGVIAGLAQGMTAGEWIEIDQRVRRNDLYFSADLKPAMSWYHADVSKLKELRGTPGYPAMLGVASSHHSGYVREGLVRALDEIEDGSEIPFLLLRLNDWVPQVRQAALQALEHRLKPEYAPQFAAHLDMVQRLLDWTRDDHAPFGAQVFKLLEGTANGQAVIQGLTSSNLVIRRISYRLAFNVPSVDKRELVERALGENHLAIALLAIREARARLKPEDLVHATFKAAISPFMPVRREHFELSCEVNPEGKKDILQAALLDRHSTIRHWARHYVTQSSPMDFAAFYREAIPKMVNNNSLYAALGGLGETGSATDAALLLSFIDHKMPSIRKMAVRSLAKLNADGHIDLFVRLIEDPSPGVSRMASHALMSKILLVQGEAVWKILAETKHPHIAKNALILLAQLPKWDSLLYLLRAVTLADDDLTPAVHHSLEQWIRNFNQSFSQPSKAQLEKIQAALPDAFKKLPVGYRGHIQNIFDALPS